MTSEIKEEVIELRVNEIAQLFHTLDPFPFRERDLDHEAEEFIVAWARDLPTEQSIKILIHFPDSEAQRRAASELGEAFNRYFLYRADILQRDLNELFRVGRRSLGIGVCVLLVCFVSARLAGDLLIDSAFRPLVEESFLILGWVANWRPLEIFLYDWWPIARRRDLHRRLSKAAVESKPYPPRQACIDLLDERPAS